MLKPKDAKPQPTSTKFKTLEDVNFYRSHHLNDLAPFQICLPLAKGLITLNSVDVIALIAMIVSLF